MKITLPSSKLCVLRYNLLKETKNLTDKDCYVIGSEGNGCNGDYFHVDENQELEMDASDVSLASFKKEKKLAPKIWNGMTINPKVRLKLLDIADDFWDTCGINWTKIKGIHLTGSICNFNWSKFSDIDLHLVVDFSDISDRKDFVQEYFNSKKNEWNDEHNNLKIYKFPVELYVEDINAKTESSAIFNLETNAWIKAPLPDDIHSIKLDKYEIKEKSANLMTKIDNYCDLFDDSNNVDELKKLYSKTLKLSKKIKAMRKFGLKRNGESDPYNIVVKCMRRMGYLDKLYDLSNNIYNKMNSMS